MAYARRCGAQLLHPCQSSALLAVKRDDVEPDAIACLVPHLLGEEAQHLQVVSTVAGRSALAARCRWLSLGEGGCRRHNGQSQEGKQTVD